MNPRPIPRIRPITLKTRTWFRAVRPQLATSPPRPSRNITRFNPGPKLGPHGFALLYFAPDPVTALLEIQSLLGSFSSNIVPNPAQNATVLRYTISQTLNVYDLTEPATCTILGTTQQELTGDWRMYRPPEAPAATQLVASILYTMMPPAHGFLARSARNPAVNNLVLFWNRIPDVDGGA